MQLTNSNGESSLGGIMDLIRTFEDTTSTSLFQYTKRAVIMSRVFIEKNLAGEEILTPLMLNIMNIYTGLIMTALNMNQYVYGSKKIRDAMSVVATESLSEAPADLQSKFNDYFLGTQSQLMLSERSMRELHAGMEAATPPGAAAAAAWANARNKRAKAKSNPKTNNSSSTNKSSANYIGSFKDTEIVNNDVKDATLPSGRVIAVDFGSKKGSTFKVNMYLQLLPTFIPSDVAHQFIEMNFTPSVRQRWMQVSAGEISFFKDFLLGQDRRRKRFAALRDDRTGALKEMVERQENNLSSAWLKLAQVTPERQNIANTILIFEKNSFDRACNTAGLRFKDYNSRQQFFNKTFSMIVVTIDPMYNRIEMYYHGLNAVSTFTFDQMKKNSKTEAVDLMSMMKTFANGMAPKF